MEFFTEKELCSLLKVDSVVLWRCRKSGLPFIRLGTKMIRYNLADVLQWFQNNGNEVA